MTKEEAIMILKNYLIDCGKSKEIIDSDFQVCKEERNSNITSFLIRHTLKAAETTPIGQTLDHVIYYVDDNGRCLPLPV
ncbi:MAG: hypothetical protein K6C13_09935 [Oscillospiraceae bacterium]|nr:hypothetical protein [Oscillospiraceae bacterium]